MKRLKTSMLGLGLAITLAGACSSSTSTPDAFVVTPTSDAASTVPDGATSDASTTPDLPPASGMETGTAAETGVSSGSDTGAPASTCTVPRESHLAIINAPTTGGLDVTGSTPPAYASCR